MLVKDWCLADGRITLLDVYTAWLEEGRLVDYSRPSMPGVGVPPGSVGGAMSGPVKKGSLLIVSDACFSGAWCAFFSWLYVEYRGFMDTREFVDRDNMYEPLDRVFIQAASGRRWEAYDAIFAKWLVEAQLDGVGDTTEKARSPYRLYKDLCPIMYLRACDLNGDVIPGGQMVNRQPSSPEYWAGAQKRDAVHVRLHPQPLHLPCKLVVEAGEVVHPACEQRAVRFGMRFRG